MQSLTNLLNKQSIQFITTKTHVIINPTNSPQFSYLYHNFDDAQIIEHELISIPISSIPTELPNPQFIPTT